MNTEYVVSSRCVLRRGDLFRVTEGPYYECADGSTMPFGEDSPVFTFLRYNPEQKLIEALTEGRQFCVLRVGKRTTRWKMLPSVVLRPYKIAGKVGTRVSWAEQKEKRRRYNAARKAKRLMEQEA